MADSEANGNKSIPSSYPTSSDEIRRRRLAGIENNKQVDAILTKLVKDQSPSAGTPMSETHNEVSIPDPSYLKQISDDIAQDSTDATSLMQLLPDLELVKNLLVSSILAPKDLVSNEVTFSIDRRAFDLPITGQMLDIIIDYFNNVYNIKALCPEILEESLFISGSYPLLVIPESAVDELINGSGKPAMESFNRITASLADKNNHFRSLGILGEGPGKVSRNKDVAVTSLESFRKGQGKINYDDGFAKSLGDKFAATVTITDNFDSLKMPAVMEAQRQVIIKDKIRGSMEARGGNYEMGGFYRNNKFRGGASSVKAIKTQDMLAKPTVGNPLVMKVPSEAVIPVFITPDKHLGYFLLLDAEGNFIQLANSKDIYHDLANINNGNNAAGSSVSQMINMTKNLSMGTQIESQNDPEQMSRVYGELLEYELRARLANGMYGKNVNVKGTEDIYRVMMARSFKNQMTQMLYVPVELMTYVAFDYSESGTGRSLNEKSKIIGSMRAMMGFANVMSGIKNSVSRQRVNLQLSDNDVDPYKTVARTMDEFTRRRNVTMPFVASDPADMISYLNMAGVEWNIEGKGLPSHKVDVEDKVSNRNKVDSELDEMLRDRHYMAFGLTPETVTASGGADFATTVITNNQLLAKRIITFQDKLIPFLEDFVKKVANNSGSLRNKLYNVINSTDVDLEESADIDDGSDAEDRQGAKSEESRQTTDSSDKQLTEEQKSYLVNEVVNQFIDAIKVSLPRPDSQTLESQMERFNQKAEAIENALEYIIDPAFLSESMMGEFSDKLDEIKAAFKAYFMRQWMSQNGYLPELEEITAVDEDGKPTFNAFQALVDHGDRIARSVAPYLGDSSKVLEKINEAAKKLAEENPDSNALDSESDSDSDGMSEDGGSEDDELAPGLDDEGSDEDEEAESGEEGEEEPESEEESEDEDEDEEDSGEEPEEPEE